MRFRLLTLTASALILSGGLVAAQQQTTPETTPPPQGQGMMGQGMMGQGMMGQGMMGQGMMGRGMGHGMHRGPGMPIMLILMDTDGDGALSLEEVQTAHARIFKQVDADRDGKVTFEEMQAFFRGTAASSEQ